MNLNIKSLDMVSDKLLLTSEFIDIIRKAIQEFEDPDSVTVNNHEALIKSASIAFSHLGMDVRWGKALADVIEAISGGKSTADHILEDLNTLGLPSWAQDTVRTIINTLEAAIQEMRKGNG